MRPFLSICVPSRNRQRYFQDVITALTKTKRQDIQFVFSDNSDDPELMNSFMMRFADDPRVVFLPSTGTTLAMMDNWERTIRATTGEWISFIGDDDYIDPDLVLVLKKVIEAFPDLDAFDWSQLYYNWPGVSSIQANNFIELESKCFEVPQPLLYRRAFRWEAAIVVPISGFSVYHGAIKRDLADRIRDTFGGRYFEHPTPDFDFGFKAVLLGKRFVWSQRPLSVLGCCAESNTAGIYSYEGTLKAVERFEREMGRDLNADSYLSDFPFHSALGVPVVILQVQHWLKKQYGISEEGWEQTFVECCGTYCEIYTEKNAFDLITEGYRKAFKNWHDGKFATCFNPVFRKHEGANSQRTGGKYMGRLYFNAKLFHAATAAEHYKFVVSLLGEAPDLEWKPNNFMDFVKDIKDLGAPIR